MLIKVAHITLVQAVHVILPTSDAVHATLILTPVPAATTPSFQTKGGRHTASAVIIAHHTPHTLRIRYFIEHNGDDEPLD